MLERLRHHPAWPATLISLFLIFYISYDKRWTYSPIIEWDVCNYYSYIKGLLYEGDPYLRLWNADTNRMELYTYTSSQSEKMTGGLALLYLPGVSVAHIVASLSPHYQDDGISLPYRIALQYNVIPYLWLGFYFLYIVLYKVLKRHWPVILALFTLFFGTNLLYYSALENAMSHAYTFSLYSIWLYLSHEWLTKPRIIIAIAMGLLAGLIIWIRPVNIVLLPASLGLYWFLRRDERSILVWKVLPSHLLWMAAAAFLVMIPQMIYWKVTSGRWLVYSYGDEHFFFLAPKVIEGLFSWRKGWVLYSPVLLMLIPGFMALWRRSWKGASIFLAVFIVFLYVTFSWWCWWYGGGYSQRPMIDILPLLAFPISTAWMLIPRFVLPIRVLLIATLTAMIALNTFHVWQYKNYLIHFDSNTRRSYLMNFLRTTHAPGWWEALEAPDYEAAKKGLKR
ncbi:hypothetical protein JCM31826_20910 [Thermaurantimonas aggregans]|uniref:Glycosyltransferase RgtA/B/C/D-like domain-containing protein n=1 Tax=Thermaurantimonas aggregans TaxID=2173829 RepID=A0A401XNM0_9FLAO|nr:hypothetical protein [Thermaurantimonas aggregans]MCX8148027.1 hypothetical protein [Thermaurantimonas aggregans]GCD78609.1 hypothetical protein JCM31826_20910 [Thermaurantimonas aggregans]